jgi:hypothetical protein
MKNEIVLKTEDAYQIADNFALASARILEFRVTNRASLSKKDATQLEKCEDTLDSMVVLFRGYGIRLIGANAEGAVTKLKLAIDSAKKTLETISNIKMALNVASALVDLAHAVLRQDPDGIIEAAKRVTSLSKEKTGKGNKRQG